MISSLGRLLVHKDSGRYSYFHLSSNNATLFERPQLVENDADLDDFLDDLTLMAIAR